MVLPMIDPTNSTKDVVHFMIPKPVVMQIAEQINKNGQAADGLMKFTFKPAQHRMEIRLIR